MTEENGTPKAESKAKRKRAADGESLPQRVASFVRESISELRRVVWPTRQQVLTYTGVVLVFVVVLSIVVNLIDIVVGKGVLAIFG